MEKFEQDLENLKNKINSMTLSDEFKENLSKKLEMEYSKTTTKTRFFVPKQIVAACACCILLTGCVFAGSFGNVITNLFANTSKEMEQAIESGEVQYINMDYVERDGVSIKVDYAMAKDDALYLVFNVLSEEEFDKIKFVDYEIIDTRENIIYNKANLEFDVIEEINSIKRLNERNAILFIKLNNISNISNINISDIVLKKIRIKNMNDIKVIENVWNFSI